MVRPLHIRGAHIWDGSKTLQHDLFTDGDRIAAAPVAGAQVIDLDGYTIFPGLINAHDHLELNHYPRSKFREKYDNAHQWGGDMNGRLNNEPYRSLRAYPIWDKLFIGGLKNLLCGATTVAHHNPPHKELWRKDFPVRVLKQYGWSHSLHFSTDEEIVRSYRSTPKDWPWFIHLAEGTDDVAAGEYRRLKSLGCVGVNTVIIHGTGMNDDDIVDASVQKIKGFVWCPSTNLYLLEAHANVKLWNELGIMIGLGNDSRLTSDGDFLCEINNGRANSSIAHYWTTQDFISIVTKQGAVILGENQIGSFETNSFGDFFAYDSRWVTEWQHPALPIDRPNIALIVKGGVPQIGDPELMAKFTDIKTVDATLDGKPKAIHIELAKRIHANSLKEAGLEVDVVPKKLFSFINR